MPWYQKLFGEPGAKAVKGFSLVVKGVNVLEPKMQALSDAELRAKTAEFRKRLGVANALATTGQAGISEVDVGAEPAGGGQHETLDDILPEAFAVVREAARRTLGQRHFDVQLVGGMILHYGNIAEMRTGEGKTLVATLPAYLNALEGKGVHIVTVNDYLSRRDAVWMGQIYNALGLSVGVVNTDASYLYDAGHKQIAENLTAAAASGTPADTAAAPTITTDEQKKSAESFKVFYEFLRPSSRRDAYAADITYGTNNEFGFDYLRDNIEYTPANLRQRDFHYAIVDEIDSILIDEARTPLIISAPTVESENLYDTFAKISAKMTPVPTDTPAGTSPSTTDGDYTVDEKFKSISLTDAGITKAEKALGVDNIYTEKGIKYVHHLETAIRAKALFHKDKEYVVRDGQVIIVDEFTGRLQPGRRWSEGLHQAVEAKEGVKVEKESRTYASITFQNYFRLYKKLSGMTGTALTSKEEFFKVYGLEVVPVPTNKPITRADHNDLIFQTEQGKFKAIARKIKELNQKGQPVLIGTVSIEKNELLSEYLKREGVKHELLNAKPQHAEREGEIVAQAGRRGAVTLSTNMAGRGVDIKLGGNPATPEQYEEVRTLGGLFVLGTERHEARRIDNQLRGRSGRQGDPGETQFFVSLQDSLMRIFASDSIGRLMGRFGIAEDEAVENRLITRSLESAQTKIEGFNFDSRKNVLEYDDVLNLQRMTIYSRRRAILIGEQAGIESQLEEVVSAVGEDGHVVGRASGNAAGKIKKAAEPEFIGDFEGGTQHVADESAEGETTDANAGSSNTDTARAHAADQSELATKIRATIEEKKKLLGDKEFYAVIRRLFLQTIDMFWIDHLEVMDYLRSSVKLRAYGQRDPLVEYKKEGLKFFKEMELSADEQILKMLPNIGAGAFVREEQQMRDTQKQMKLINDNAPGGSGGQSGVFGGAGAQSGARGAMPANQNLNKGGNFGAVAGANLGAQASKPLTSEPKIGRNDPCPCGSGKKWKQCGLINSEEHQKRIK